MPSLESHMWFVWNSRMLPRILFIFFYRVWICHASLYTQCEKIIGHRWAILSLFSLLDSDCVQINMKFQIFHDYFIMVSITLILSQRSYTADLELATPTLTFPMFSPLTYRPKNEKNGNKLFLHLVRLYSKGFLLKRTFSIYSELSLISHCPYPNIWPS